MREVPPTLDTGSPQPIEPLAVVEPKIKNPSKLEKLKYFLNHITVEPIIMLLVAPRLLCHLTNENLNLEKACYVNLGYNDSVCYAMVVRNTSGYTPAQENAVQQVVSSLLPYKQTCHVVQICTLLLVSSLCDRFQKIKPMFYIPFIGEMSAMVGYMTCVYFFMSLSAEYSIFVEGILTVSFGGFQLLLAGCYSYVASISDAKSRTVRIGAVALVSKTCMTLGVALSGWTFKFFGFYGVYSIALTLNLLGVGYAFFFVKEIRMKDSQKKEEEPKNCCYLVWNGTWNTLCNSLKVCFKEGTGRRRARMIILQMINFVSFGSVTAEYAIMYMYSRKKFGWDEVDYSMYKAYKTMVEVAGSTFVLAYFSKHLQWSDATIGILAASCKVAGTIILAFSPTGLIFYLGTLTDLLSGAILISVRSMISKVVNNNEQAMANSITSVMDSIGLFVIGPLYSFIYYSTLAIFPGAFFLFSTCVNLPIIILFYFLYRLQNKYKS